MNVLKTTLSVMTVLLLAACGNGGTYQPDLTHAPTVKPKPSASPATSSNAGGSSSAKPLGGTSSPAAGGTSLSSAGSGSTGTQPSTPQSTGNTAGSQPNTGSSNLPTSVAGSVHAGYAKGFVSRGGAYYEKNPPVPSSGNLSGDIVSVSKQLNVVHSQPPAGNTNYERININGVTLSLLPGKRFESDDGVVFYNSSEVSDKLGLAVGKWLQYSSYGMVDLDDEQRYGLSADRRYAFAHGEPTANMPTSGKAKYSGYMLGFYDLEKDRPYEENHNGGIVDLDVDFGSKKVEGLAVFKAGNYAFTLNNNGRFMLNADISGNRFAGTSKDGVVTKGGFYGPNAAEMAGTFTTKSDALDTMMGSFGAKKIDRARYLIEMPDDQK